jgi:hypothetical protein
MDISPEEAAESLQTIQRMGQRSRHSFASSGAYIFLIVTGLVWLVGFLATQFLAGPIVATVWVGASLLGSAFSVLLGTRSGRRVRSPNTGTYARRLGLFWLMLILYGAAAVAVARPADGKQVTMLVILFIMLGQTAMGLLLSFSATWWALPIMALALLGYFLLPGWFYLWMALLGGGGMIALGLYIRLRW